MHKTVVLLAVFAASAFTACAAFAGGPTTKQNGSTPVFADFTSICAVPGYLNFGNCGGVATTYSGVAGRINAVQAKEGRWNLGFTFTHLQPGASYRLWGNQAGEVPSPGVITGFFIIGTGVAQADGTLRFSSQTTTPGNLGFDLN